MAAQAASIAAASDSIHTKAEHVDGRNHGPQGTPSVHTPSLSWNGVLLPALGFPVPREQGTASGREEAQAMTPLQVQAWVGHRAGRHHGASPTSGMCMQQCSAQDVEKLEQD